MTHRLSVLAEFLETKVPPERFTMGAWAARKTVRDECGFAGCAIGWAARSGLFPGLTLSGDDGGIPLYQGQCCYTAIAALFGISDADARYLFAHGSYNHRFPPPSEVAGRIRRYLDLEAR